MKGTTHLLIGAAVGTIYAAYTNMDFQTGAACVAISSFSALSADLDGNSILNRNIDKASKFIRECILGLGFVLFIAVIILYLYFQTINLVITGATASLLLIGCLFHKGLIRNILLTTIGLAMLYTGITKQWLWLDGLALFIGVAPWLKHRGLTHTIWAVLLWGLIGWGVEQHFGISGIALVATLGYLSHLVADSLTTSGIKWFYPIWNKSFRPPFR